VKITLETRKFRERFAIAASVAPSRPAKPICENVLVDFKLACMTSTDLERWTVVQFECPQNNCQLLLPAFRTTKILEAIRCDVVEIDVTKGKAAISGGGSKFTVQTADDKDFPRCPKPQKPLWSVRVNSATLCGALSRTKFAMDEQSTRYALGGVCLYELDGLAAVATDGRRLSLCKLGHSVAFASNPIIPASTVAAILRTFGAVVGDVEVSVEASAITISGGGVLLRSPLVEGRFPRIAEVIPDAPDRTFEITSEVLLKAIDDATIVCARDQEGDLLTGCDLSCRVGELVLRAVGAEVGESEIVVPCNAEQFAPITLDVAELRPWLQAIGRAAAVEVYLSGPDSAAKFVSGEATFVLMPMVKE